MQLNPKSFVVGLVLCVVVVVGVARDERAVDLATRELLVVPTGTFLHVELQNKEKQKLKKKTTIMIIRKRTDDDSISTLPDSSNY